jgi:hypothetical protein
LTASYNHIKEVKDMARSDTRYSVYPSPRAVEVIGNSAPQLNQAIESWAAMLCRAIADNAKKFWNAEATHLTGRTQDMYALKEWCVLAEATRNLRFDPEFANPGELLATAVEDADKLESIGARWFSTELEEYSEDILVGELAKKLRELDYAHAWAIVIVVRWFWEHHHEGIDIENDLWWTLAFRRQWKPKQSVEKQKHSADEKPGARTKKKTEQKK